MPATILLSAYPGRNVSGGRQLAMATGGALLHGGAWGRHSSFGFVIMRGE